MSLWRVFVEKREGFDVEAKRLQREIKEFLHIEHICNVRIFNRYDMEHVTEAVYRQGLHTIFSEPQADDVYEEHLPQLEGFVFATSYLKGQYDQRADSCVQCMRVLDSRLEPVVQTAKIYAIEGELTGAEQEKIKKHLINPIECEEISLDKPTSLAISHPTPQAIQIVEGFISYSHEALEAYRQEQGLAMSLEDLIYFQKYFKSQDRNPSFTEIKVVDTYWSDHCRHTTFMTELTGIEVAPEAQARPIREALHLYEEMREELYANKDKKVCLMDLATIGTKYLKKQGKLKGLVESAEINACTIEETIQVDDREEAYLVLFKNETHNHPTEIEPYGGAATCLGGAIRDPLSGRAYVYQAMRVTGAADPNESLENTLKGKLPQRKITRTAANGYSAYGNQIGLATGEVKEYYHEGYKAKRLEVGAVVGAVPKANVRREEPVAGDVILLLGGATGRDGCGGATGSSKEHTEDSLKTCGSEVQKGNPVEERKLQRLFRKPEFSRLIKRCNDFGAGGVCVAIGEIAEGLVIDLDAVPVKYTGLDGTELAISESQERMAIAIEAADESRVKAMCQMENLSAVKVAVVTQEKHLVMTWRGEEIVNIDRQFLDSAGVTQKREAYIGAPSIQEETMTLSKEKALHVLSDLNVGLQKGLGMQFDGSIGAGSVLMPYGGKEQLTKEVGMVAKIPVLDGETSAATYMTHGFDPYLSEASPFHGALYAVVESIAKLAALGADYTKTFLSFQEYFERLGEQPDKWGKPIAALLGALKAQKEFEIGAIGGKDSMSGTFEALHVPPTLISFTCNVGDASHCVSGSLKEVGSQLVAAIIEKDTCGMPDFEKMRAVYSKVHTLAVEGHTRSAYAVGKGGLVATLTQMAIGNGIGVVIDQLPAPAFEAAYGSLVLEVSKEVAATLDPALFVTMGETTQDASIMIGDVTYSLKEAVESLEKPLKEIFADRGETVVDAPDATINKPRKIYIAQHAIARPNVVIPVFPGTNCEYDTARAFSKAGADVTQVLFVNNTPDAIVDSVARLEEAIGRAQIVAFPGGFSAGDEPDGSGKFIGAVMRSEGLKEALHKHIYTRDGLMLGICNGFQVLVKLGLLPYGEIREMDQDCPTLTYNTIGKHISLMSKTKITSTNSPWLANVNVGESYEIALSHGEGRFVAPQPVLDELLANGQIFSQYVNQAGQAVGDGAVNINGSMYNIEGIVSLDGRIIGKMGHSERVGDYVHTNIPGNKDQKLFEAGVKYYR